MTLDDHQMTMDDIEWPKPKLWMPPWNLWMPQKFMNSPRKFHRKMAWKWLSPFGNWDLAKFSAKITVVAESYQMMMNDYSTNWDDIEWPQSRLWMPPQYLWMPPKFMNGPRNFFSVIWLPQLDLTLKKKFFPKFR